MSATVNIRIDSLMGEVSEREDEWLDRHRFDPNQQPIVRVDDDLAEWLMSQPGSCRVCGGLNWHHTQGCRGGAE